MGRSSRFLCFLATVLVAPLVMASTVVEARGLAVHVGVGFGARPFVGVPRVPVPPRIQPAPRLVIHPGLRAPGRFGRFGRGFGYGGLDAAGLGLSMASEPMLPLPPGGVEPEPIAEPRAMPPRPRRCVRPLIITVGNGLRHPAKTKIIYGAPPPCGY